MAQEWKEASFFLVKMKDTFLVAEVQSKCSQTFALVKSHQSMDTKTSVRFFHFFSVKVIRDPLGFCTTGALCVQDYLGCFEVHPPETTKKTKDYEKWQSFTAPFDSWDVKVKRDWFLEVSLVFSRISRVFFLVLGFSNVF